MKNSILLFLNTTFMEGLGLYSQYFIKIAIKTKAMFTSTPTTVAAGITVLGVTAVSNEQAALFLLGILYAMDFITGVLASKTEKDKLEIIRPSLSLRNLITSEKLKLSLIKAFTYGSTIIVIHMIEKIFIVKEYEVAYISEHPMSITLIFIGICCAIEFYSIFFENFKRMGYDFTRIITKTLKGLKNFISDLKD